MYNKFFACLFFAMAFQGTTLNAQHHEDTFAYNDQYDQTIIISNSSELPKNIDTTFLRKNLNSKHLLTVSDSALLGKVNFLITEVRPYKKKGEYQITLKYFPKSAEMYEKLRERGSEYFLLRTYRQSKELHLVEVSYMYAKIKMK
jgi:hypothetical protein